MNTICGLPAVNRKNYQNIWLFTRLFVSLYPERENERFMKRKLIQMMRWICTKGLVWLGFGATPFIFMACYGPVPTNYHEVTFDEEVVDSSVVGTRDMAEESVAVEDSTIANDEI